MLSRLRLSAVALSLLVLLAPLAASFTFEPDDKRPGSDAACIPDPLYHTYVAWDSADATGRAFSKEYRFMLNGTPSLRSARFYDGCIASGGDGTYEWGRGGALLNHTRVSGQIVRVLDVSALEVPFLIGADVDGTGIVGDTSMDCLEGPFVGYGTATCPPDRRGNLVVFVLDPAPVGTPDAPQLDWGRIWTCPPYNVLRCLVHHVSLVEVVAREQRRLFQEDHDGDGLGDYWQDQIRSIYGTFGDRHMDQEAPNAAHPLGGDGATNIEEFRWLTIPVGPISEFVLANAYDYDRDGWDDGTEIDYWNNVDNDPIMGSWTTVELAPVDPDRNQNFDEDEDYTTTWDPDSDNDGQLDGWEIGNGTYPEFADSDCKESQGPCTSVPSNRWDPDRKGTTGAGDLVNDHDEPRLWRAAGLDPFVNYDWDFVTNNLIDPDSDNDDLLDGEELRCPATVCLDPLTSPRFFDTDNDGLLDGNDVTAGPGEVRYYVFLRANVAHTQGADGSVVFHGERTAKTNATRVDTDGDCLPDGWEVRYRTDPLMPDASGGKDLDGLSNLFEYRYPDQSRPCNAPVWWGGMNPTLTDTDGDNLADNEEITYNGNPHVRDTDLDGLQDGDERWIHTTHVNNPDPDGDGLTDYQEAITYRETGVNAWAWNTDNPTNVTTNDTLSDYEEIVRHKTKPNDWDTDDDGVADGRDANPLHSDAQPPRQPLTTASPAQPRQTAYVVFGQGYVDVMVQDAHGAEGDIQAAEVRVRLDGKVNGVANHTVIHQEAARLDGGSFWGARIGVPSNIVDVWKETFTLTIVGASGNVVTYSGTANQAMQPVVWNDDSDPVHPNDWSSLKVHQAPPAAQAAAPTTATPAGTSASANITLDPYQMSAEQLFATFGAYQVYRLKPFALPAAELQNLTDAHLFASIREILVVEDAPDDNLTDDNATLAEPSAPSWSIHLWENAFELVDPTRELGVYQTMATNHGGTHGLKNLRMGVQKAWEKSRNAAGFVKDEATAQGASFLFGADDPRARGRMAGDIVAGILVYGDVRDVVVGIASQDELKAALGAFGIGLTWLGPGADGPYSAFKVGIKTILNAPRAGKEVALKLFNTLTERMAPLARSGDVATAMSLLMVTGKNAKWLASNGEDAADFYRIQLSLDPAIVDTFEGKLDNIVAASAGLHRAYGGAAGAEVATQDALYAMSRPSTLFASGGPGALKEMADVSAVLYDAAPKTATRTAADVDAFLKNLHDARNAPGVDLWWRDHGGAKELLRNVNGRWGKVFEMDQYARFARGEISVIGENGVRVTMTLERVDDAAQAFIPGRGLVEAQVDLWAKYPDGRKVLTECKSGFGGADSTAKSFDQMERQLAVQKQLAEESPSVYAKEIHWRFEQPPTKEMMNDARALMNMYPDMQVRFFGQNGFEIPIP